VTGRPPRAPAAPSRLALLVLALLGSVAAADCQRSPDPLLPGSRAPDFTLDRIGADAPVSLRDARERVVLINFWATTCPPCEAEMPAMERLYRGLRDEGFELLAVSVDEDAAEVEAFRERHGLTFPILHDPDRAVANAYQTFRFPESLLIDRHGIVAGRFIGEKDWDSPLYVARIRELLRPSAAVGVGEGSAGLR
jgi:peroxiredoxin